MIFTPDIITDMSERLLTKTDRYFRNPNTRFSHTLQRISPETGLAYRTSRKKDIAQRVIALPLAIAATPVIGALAIAKKIEDGGPSFYKAQRIGHSGEIFDMWKIRTLVVDADKDTIANHVNASTPGIPQDRYSTRLGSFLRKWRLDELPQLWQVVNGNMSLIEMRSSSETSWEVMQQHRTSDIDDLRKAYESGKPGLINPHVAFHKKGTIDEKYYISSLYARRASLGLDMYILFRTLTRPFLTKK